MLRVTHLLDALASAGCDDGATYVSMPISSGLREVEVAAKKGCVPGQLREQFPAEWERVRLLNETDGRDAVERVRSRDKRVVVDPSRIGVDGWSQADYMAFWLGFMQRFPIMVVAAPGWQYSRGARTEINLARSQQIAVLDVAGSVLSDELITCQLQAAEDRLQQFGFAPEIIGAYLEPIVLHGGLTQSAAAKAFDWLAGERSYQLAKFGTAVDDEHTLAGVGVDTWWDQQLTNYLGRFRLFGPDQILGRQAMAKFVATSLGMLESSIRVYGDLPQSGVASGEIRKSAHEEDPR